MFVQKFNKDGYTFIVKKPCEATNNKLQLSMVHYVSMAIY